MGSGGKTTQVQSNDPWAGAQPYLLESMAAASQLFNRGPSAYYGGQAIADLNPVTAAGWNQQQQYLTGGQPQSWINQQQQALSNIIGAGTATGQPGYTPAQAAQSQAAQLQGQFGADRGQIMGGTGGQALTQTAAGGMNPWLDQMVSSAQGRVAENLRENILPGVAAGAQQAGQYGSSRQGIAEGLAMRDANREASNLAAQMYGQAYDADAARRLQAGTSLLGTDVNLAQFNAGQGLNVAQQNAQMQQQTALQNAGNQQQANLQNAANQMQAGRDLTGYQLQALGMAPNIIQQNLGLGQALSGVGQNWQNYQQQLLDQGSQRYQYEQAAPWDLVNRYNAVAMGQGGLGGTQTATGPGPNPIAGAAGGAMSGFSMGGPWGALIGAGLGYLGSR